MKALERLEQKYTRKRTYPAAACNFEMSQNPEGDTSYVIWFEYTNNAGTKSKTPKLTIDKDIIQDLGEFWKREGLISQN